MFVDPDYHRQGIGSQLLARIEQVAKDRGIFKLSLMTSIPAEGFYQKFGYVKTGEETNHMGRVILMSKELSH
jgi:GNAT superfamily N-acetyltransferase